MPNPNDLTSYNFSSNPYMEMVKKSQQQTPQGMLQEMAQEPQQQMANPNQSMGQAQQQGMQSQGMMDEQNQLQKGVNPDGLKLIIGAINGLERFVTNSQNREDIMIIRGVISVLSRLIAKVQSDQMDQMNV